MRLAELQHALQAHLFEGSAGIEQQIIAAPPLPVAERLGIYRNAYRIRLIEALDSTYPVLHQILGDELFEAMGSEFVAEQRSVHRSIRWYGSELKEFLLGHAPFIEQPLLAELATLEWTLSEVFDSADADAVRREDMLSIAPEAWDGLSFVFHPSIRRLTLGWNTVAVWQAVTREEDPPPPQRSAEPVCWLLWRQDLQNYFRSLTAEEQRALEAALAGRTFGQICESLRGLVAEDDIPLTVAGYLNVWVAGGLIAKLG